ncbi:MAG: ribosome small subunit-dependent GTPase A [Candidatus Planktophila sp.]|nr:ribosome small subunit-dependent GTPase A [Candidatus Planktophila sp.]MSO24803.1 ribosome small subunit-dependent GTPase A [Candidatus Planktophila sp.]PHX69652.1 MAG: ribosome small subunit-dependent GTPase A [Actinomycetota bacterium]
MSPREYDESDARIRPSRTTRRRTKDRPSHSDSITAFVTTVDRGRTTCVTDEGVIITAMKARELGPKSVVVGDLVEIVGDVTGSEGSLARIVVVNERTNSLSRTVDDVARVERTIVANIDQLLIVVASANPEPRRGLIDRFLVSAFHESIKPIIIVTKVDVSPVPEFIQEYKALGVDIITTSSKTDARTRDITTILEILDDKISVLVGHSGVGKSTLINDLVPDADRMTGDVNDVTGRGRHTSSSAIALPLENGGWIIDTPGIRAFGLSHLNKDRIIESFPDVYQVTQTCMPNCSHHEISCSLNPWIESDPSLQVERLRRVTSLRSLLEVKLAEDEG